ncbi:MAG: YDG domain-containing protein, partial [Verrucomicrobiota bacterium]
MATLSSQTLSGIISPDDVSLLVGNASFSDPVPGSGKTVTAGNLCLAGSKAANYILSQATATATAAIFTVPLTSIAGPKQVCAEVTPQEYSIDNSMVSCQWSVSQGGVITSGQGTSRISVIWNTPGPQSIAVIYANANGCPVNTSATMNVTVNPLVSPHIDGPTALCEGTTGVTYLTEEGMTDYRWSISPGGTITSGAGTRTITVNWIGAGVQNLGVTYKNSFGCSPSLPVVYNVTVKPLPSPTISGTTDLCAESAGNVYTTEAGKRDYLWNVSAGGIITSGANTNTAFVTWSTAGIQSVSVTYTNTEGCQPLAPSPKTVKVNPLPATPGAVSGKIMLCAASQGVGYSIQPVANATGYVWKVPTGATIASGAGTPVVTVNYGSTALSGVITVYATNSCGSSSPSSLIVSTSPLVVAAGAINGPSSVCQGATGLRFSVPPITNATNYSWILPGGYTIAGGAGTNAITVNLDRYAQS